MTNRDIAVIGCKIFSLYFFWNALTVFVSIPFQLIHYIQGQEADILILNLVLFVLIFLSFLTVGLVLWKKAPFLAKDMLQKEQMIDAKMTAESLEVFLLSLLGFYIVLSNLSNFVVQFTAIFGPYGRQFYAGLLWSVSALTIFCGIVLMFKAQHIANLIYKLRFKDIPRKSQALSLESAQTILILLFGVYLIALSLPAVCGAIIQLFLAPETHGGLLGMFERFTMQGPISLMDPLVRLCVGLGLVLGAQGVSNLITRFRGK